VSIKSFVSLRTNSKVRDRGVYKVLRIFEDELYLDDVDIYGEVQSLDISYSELSPQSVEFKVYSV